MLQDFIVNFPFVWNETEFTVIFSSFYVILQVCCPLLVAHFMLYYKYVAHCLWHILCYITSMLPIAGGTFYVHVISELAVIFERFVV